MKKKKLRYYPKAHTYWIGKQKLESVTTFISKYFEKFDSKKIARKLAKFPHNRKQKHGVRYFLNEWKERGEHGTRVHEGIEQHLKGEVFPDELTEEDVLKIQQGLKAFHQLRVKYPDAIVNTEFKVYSTELRLAGTIDLLLVNELTGEAILVDWKSNKKLTQEGFDGKVGIHKLTSDLADCHFTKYSLQLSTYALMVEEQLDLKVTRLLIVHLKEDDFDVFEVPYMRKKVMEMIEDESKNV